MEPNLHIKKIIQETFSSELLKYEAEPKQISPERMELINSYLDKRLREFTNEIKDIVIKNDHPYINVYLKDAVEDLKKTIAKNRVEILGFEELYL